MTPPMARAKRGMKHAFEANFESVHCHQLHGRPIPRFEGEICSQTPEQARALFDLP